MIVQYRPGNTADEKPSFFSRFFSGLKQTYNEFSEDDVMTQAAAIAFYTGLSIAPLLTISVWIAQYVLGDQTKERIADAFAEVLGPTAGAPIKELLALNSPVAEQGMTISGLISLALVAFSASTVFAQLQAALNRIWGVKAEASSTTGTIWLFVKKRLLSFGMILSLLFLLLISGVASTIIQALVGNMLASGWILSAINQGISFFLFAALFAAMFRYLPDVRISWSDVWVGGLISAALFVVGKYCLGLYLGRSEYGSSYGAAIGSFLAMLVWVYYSSTIVMIGAEATQVYARRNGGGLEPEEHAVRVVKEERPATQSEVQGTKTRPA